MFQSSLFWTLRQTLRRIWVRIAAISALAFILPVATPLAAVFVPASLDARISEEAVTELLSILTNSMLAVAIFSLSVMVSAHHYAASQVTPRSHRLLREDGRTQSVLATFIGAFVYALVALAIINAGFFAGRDFLVVYGVTIVVIGLVIVALVRWVQQIAGLGSIEVTTERVETAARAALDARMAAPFLGGLPPAQGPLPPGTIAVHGDQHGWVQTIDMGALQTVAKAADARIHLRVLPGDRVTPGTALMDIEADRFAVKDMALAAEAVTVDRLRSYDQDPVFGIEVLSEIAQRALSPGLNDPRTAVHILARQHAVVDRWCPPEAPDAPAFDRIHLRGLSASDLVTAAFDHIARDGAHIVEVQQTLQQVLKGLADHDAPEMADAARAVSARALERSEAALTLPEDRARVRDAAP